MGDISKRAFGKVMDRNWRKRVQRLDERQMPARQGCDCHGPLFAKRRMA
jgi:hypothetical protein